MQRDDEPAFNPRIFENHAKGLRVIDRSQETGPAFRLIDAPTKAGSAADLPKKSIYRHLRGAMTAGRVINCQSRLKGLIMAPAA